jgi:hypothetical protein
LLTGGRFYTKPVIQRAFSGALVKKGETAMKSKTFGMAALAFLCFFASLAYGQSTNVSGNWVITITHSMGASDANATIKQDGEKLSGTIATTEAGELSLEGNVTGKDVKLTYKVSMGGMDLLITLTGSVDGQSMKGTADFGGMGQGDWSAKRAEGSAPAAASAAPGSTNLSGNWVITINHPMGTSDDNATIKQDGEKLSGTIASQMGELPLKGDATGKDVKLIYTVSTGGQDIVITLTGSVDGQSMKGTADFGGMGQGDWSAKRK